MRVFLFGSSFGAATSFILKFRDRIATTDTLGYFASNHTRTYGLLGACFVWLFLPIMSWINTIYDTSFAASSVTYLTPAILNLWFALSASCCMSFCMSILLGRKIHPHDIVFSSFSVICFLFLGRYFLCRYINYKSRSFPSYLMRTYHWSYCHNFKSPTKKTFEQSFC